MIRPGHENKKFSARRHLEHILVNATYVLQLHITWKILNRVTCEQVPASHSFVQAFCTSNLTTARGLEIFLKTHRRSTVYRAPGRVAPCPYSDFTYAYAGPVCRGARPVCRGTCPVRRGTRRPGAGERPKRSSDQSRPSHAIQKHIACKRD